MAKWGADNGVLRRRVRLPVGFGLDEWMWHQRETAEAIRAAMDDAPVHIPADAPFLVAAHGMGGSMGNFHLIRDDVVLKMGGVCLTGVVGGHRWTEMPMHLDHMARNFRNGLEQLGIASNGHAKVMALGHSLGGIVLAKVAMWHPEWFHKVIFVDSPVGEEFAEITYRKLVEGLGTIGVDVLASLVGTAGEAVVHGHLVDWGRSVGGMFLPPSRLLLTPPHTLQLLRSGIRDVSRAPRFLDDHGVEVVSINGALDLALGDLRLRHEPDAEGIRYISVPGIGHALPLTKRGAEIICRELSRPLRRRPEA